MTMTRRHRRQHGGRTSVLASSTFFCLFFLCVLSANGFSIKTQSHTSLLSVRHASHATRTATRRPRSSVSSASSRQNVLQSSFLLFSAKGRGGEETVVGGGGGSSSGGNSGTNSSLPSASASSTTSAVPPLFEPGSGPTVVLTDGHIAEQDIYKQAIVRTLAWVAASCTFGGVLWATAGATTGEEFFAGYLVEQSLSVDNLFVFLVLFDYFGVPLANQDRVLNWGIYGAIVMRAIMIALGAAALQHFHAILLVFAGILVYSSTKVLIAGGDDDNEDDEEDLSQNTIVQFSHKFIDSTDRYDGDKFFTVVDGVRKATPLFICMIALEISDVVFAVDSIPAVFGVTSNPLVVFSSNMFAIMGLRSLYTILSKAATDLKYLEPAVAIVLGFIGLKMILEYFGYCIPTEAALGVVLTCLGTGVGLSVREKQLEMEEEDASAIVTAEEAER